MFYLRELEKEDLVEINIWRNNSELIALLGAPFRYINYEVDEKWFDNYISNRNTQVRCAIMENGKENLLGLVSLTSINHLNQSAEFHIMIGNEESRGRGVGTFATKAMLEHAFYNLNLQRVELEVLSSNKVAKTLYEKCAFVYEGKKRKATFKNGAFVDMLMYSILREEFGGIS